MKCDNVDYSMFVFEIDVISVCLDTHNSCYKCGMNGFWLHDNFSIILNLLNMLFNEIITYKITYLQSCTYIPRLEIRIKTNWRKVKCVFIEHVKISSKQPNDAAKTISDVLIQFYYGSSLLFLVQSHHPRARKD